jgi:spermidine synthase
LRLFLDGNLQFSSVDEYRYHESLVHPALGAVAAPSRVAVLGGGDGLAVREVLRYSSVREVHLVDLDPTIVGLFRDHPLLVSLNEGALNDPRVRVHTADAMRWLEDYEGPPFDVVLIDLPDPNSTAIGKLYTRAFNRLVLQLLAQDGVIATQATSPYASRAAFWCIVTTWEQTQDPKGPQRSLVVWPYHANVPSFGEWGFVLVARRAISPREISLTVPTRFLTIATLPSLFDWPADLARVATDPNDLGTQPLVGLYARGIRERY